MSETVNRGCPSTTRAAEPARKEREELTTRFLKALPNGDMEGLIGVLAREVVMTGDGGGKAPALNEPIEGPSPPRAS